MGSTLDQKFTRHVDDLYGKSTELFDAAEDLRTLIASPGWTHLTALLDAEVAKTDRTLDGAQEPMSQAEYAMAHGRRGGLRGAVSAVEALLGRADAELDRQRQIHEGAAEPALGR